MAEHEYKLGQTSLGRLETVDPRFKEIMEEAIKTSPHDFGIAGGGRSEEEQWVIYKQGRELIPDGDPTNPADYKIVGKTFTGQASSEKKLMESRHVRVKGQSLSRAIDISVLRPGKEGGPKTYVTGDTAEGEQMYRDVVSHIRKTADTMSGGKYKDILEWGGDWDTPDLPHLQVKDIQVPTGEDIAMGAMLSEEREVIV